MSLFNFFKIKTNLQTTPEQTIRSLIDDLPEYYKSHELFEECIDFLEHRDWESALVRLMELAYESGHYFSDDFWIELANATSKMKMTEYSQICSDQIKLTKSKINWEITKGSTVNKIDDTHYEHYYSQKIKDGSNEKRRTKDNLISFINEEGFHITGPNRSGTIYYILEGRVCEIFWELSNGLPFDISLFFDSLDSWTLPTKQLLTSVEKGEIKTKLLNWLKEKNIHTSI